MSKIVKKKRRVRPVVTQVTLIGLVLLSIFLLLGATREVLEMLKLKKQADLVTKELKILEEENASLIDQSKKLEDPNYVQTYARGNYMFSKEGEQIFYLPSQAKQQEIKQEEEKNEEQYQLEAETENKDGFEDKKNVENSENSENTENIENTESSE